MVSLFYNSNFRYLFAKDKWLKKSCNLKLVKNGAKLRNIHECSCKEENIKNSEIFPFFAKILKPKCEGEAVVTFGPIAEMNNTIQPTSFRSQIIFTDLITVHVVKYYLLVGQCISLFLLIMIQS